MLAASMPANLYDKQPSYAGHAYSPRSISPAKTNVHRIVPVNRFSLGIARSNHR